MWIAREHDALSRDVLREDEGAEARDVGQRVRRRPDLREASFVQRGLEPVLREDRQVVEQPQPWGEGFRQTQHHGVVIGRRHVERLAVDRERRADRALHRFVVCGPERKEHVSGCERRAVGEAGSPPQRQRIGQSVVRFGPLLCEHRLDLVGRPVDPHQARVDQERQQVGGRARARRHIAVVGRRVGSQRNDQFSAGRNRGFRRTASFRIG